MRTHYRNGDEIDLQGCGCNGCNLPMVNGVLCHEHGCPDAWRDRQVECRECGFEFYPEEERQEFCSEHCAAMYRGLPCDCEICLEMDADLTEENEPDEN